MSGVLLFIIVLPVAVQASVGALAFVRKQFGFAVQAQTAESVLGIDCGCIWF